MKKLSLPSVLVGLVVGLVMSASIAYAVNFTIVLTQAEVDIATWEWSQEDSSHTTWSTAQLFGAARLRDLLALWKAKRQINRINIVGTPTGYFCANTWAGLSQSTKDNTICIGLLGEVTGCTPCSATGD